MRGGKELATLMLGTAPQSPRAGTRVAPGRWLAGRTGENPRACDPIAVGGRCYCGMGVSDRVPRKLVRFGLSVGHLDSQGASSLSSTRATSLPSLQHGQHLNSPALTAEVPRSAWPAAGSGSPVPYRTSSTWSPAGHRNRQRRQSHPTPKVARQQDRLVHPTPSHKLTRVDVGLPARPPTHPGVASDAVSVTVYRAQPPRADLDHRRVASGELHLVNSHHSAPEHLLRSFSTQRKSWSETVRICRGRYPLTCL
jgi:hypothetical protein